MRVVNEGLLALFATKNSVHLDMMQNQDDRFFSFSQNGVILFAYKKQRRTKTSRNASRTIVFIVKTDYIIDLCNELCLVRTRREPSFL